MVNPLIDPPIRYVDPPLDELDELLLEEDEDEAPDEDDEETPELDDELVEPPDEEEPEPMPGDAFCTELSLPQAEIASANAAARQYRRVSRTSRPHYENLFINLLRCPKRMRNNRVSRLGYVHLRRHTNPPRGRPHARCFPRSDVTFVAGGAPKLGSFARIMSATSDCERWP